MQYPSTTATVETLPNGLTLIFDPDPAAPVVSAQLWVSTGSMHEDEHLGAGLSHFLEHMVFKGTRDTDGENLANEVQAAGGHWNAYTSFDRTVYYIDGPAASLEVFLKTLTGLVFYPLLPEAEFEKEKDVIRREIDMGLDDPDNAAATLLFSTVFTKDPRRQPVIGHRHLFDELRHQDLVGYHKKRYTTERCFVVVSGDFDTAFAREKISGFTAGCLPGGGREPLIAKDVGQLGPRRGRELFAVPTSRISLAWKSPALEHPDAAAYDVLATVLGRGCSSLLHRALREECELALEISAFSWTGPGREGLIAISAEALPNKSDELIQAIFSELASISSADLSAAVAKAQRQIAASQFRSLTTASGRAADLASNWHEARDLDFTRSYLAAIQLVTAEDIQRISTGLTRERSILTILDPLDAPVPAALAKPVRVVEKIEAFTLPNGLSIALVPDRRVPLIHLQAAVKCGLPSETAEVSGINQLLAATLSKGTAQRSANEIAVMLESIGASIGASVGNNALLVQAAGLAPDLEVIADVFADVIISPSFPAPAVEREKASQLAQLGEAQQDPLYTGFRCLRDVAFCGTGYGLDALGSKESLASLDQQALQQRHAAFFCGRNMTVTLAGDFDATEARRIFSEKFSPLPAGNPWSPPVTLQANGILKTIHLPKKQAVIAIGFPGVGVSSEDRFALAMIQEYASDMAGPLFTRLREELGLAYQVSATQFLGFDSGLFTFFIATSPEQAEQARSELLAEIQKIAQQGIPGEAFERVRSTVLSGLAIQQQSPATIARHVALDLLFGHLPDSYRLQAAKYQILQPIDVQQLAQKIFSQQPCQAQVLSA